MTIYKKKTNGEWEFFTLADGRKILLAETWVIKESKRQGTRILVIK